jgi:hypothetical protein
MGLLDHVDRARSRAIVVVNDRAVHDYRAMHDVVGLVYDDALAMSVAAAVMVTVAAVGERGGGHRYGGHQDGD